MGAEGSKSSNATNKHAWLTGEEKQILQAHVKELMATSEKLSLRQLEADVSSRVGEALGKNFACFLTSWRTKKCNKATNATSPDTFSQDELTALLMEILNPDCSVQAEVMIRLAGGTGGSVAAESLLQAVAAMVGCYCNASSQLSVLPEGRVAADDGASERLALVWLHYLVYGGVSQKQTAGQPVPAAALSQAAVERWLLSNSSLYLVVQCAALRELASPRLPSIEPRLLPAITGPSGVQLRLSAPEVLLLNSALPPLLRCEWRLLFSNQIHGDSFTLLMKHVNRGAGPSLLVLEADDGCKFGGFASGSWEVRPQFHGTAECFLFSLMPSAGIYNSTGYNSNYQYLNYLHNNTMPNGLGMGGREELFGLFLSADDFGSCRVAPTCITFQSPPLCPTDSPRMRYLSVWGVGEEAQDSDDEEDAPRQRSALDRNPDARALLDMIGRGRASDGHREPDPDLEQG